MKKLELKYLAGYLPYGLIMRYTGTGRPFRGTQKNEVLTLKNIELLMFSNQRKPILKPLKDLTNDQLHIFSVDFRVAFKNNAKFTLGNYMTLYESEWLYEHHFDIHGLIENNLAIDINTL